MYDLGEILKFLYFASWNSANWKYPSFYIRDLLISKCRIRLYCKSEMSKSYILGRAKSGNCISFYLVHSVKNGSCHVPKFLYFASCKICQLANINFFSLFLVYGICPFLWRSNIKNFSILHRKNLEVGKYFKRFLY